MYAIQPSNVLSVFVPDGMERSHYGSGLKCMLADTMKLGNFRPPALPPLSSGQMNDELKFRENRICSGKPRHSNHLVSSSYFSNGAVPSNKKNISLIRISNQTSPPTSHCPTCLVRNNGTTMGQLHPMAASARLRVHKLYANLVFCCWINSRCE